MPLLRILKFLIAKTCERGSDFWGLKNSGNDLARREKCIFWKMFAMLFTLEVIILSWWFSFFFSVWNKKRWFLMWPDWIGIEGKLIFRLKNYEKSLDQKMHRINKRLQNEYSIYVPELCLHPKFSCLSLRYKFIFHSIMNFNQFWVEYLKY